MKTDLKILSVTLLVAGCGGSAFTSAGLDGTEGDAGPGGASSVSGDAGAAGGAAPAAGGSGGGVTGGSGGVTGGLGGHGAGGAQAASGGTVPSSGGVGPGGGGQGAGGAQAASGGAGGGAGTGGSPPACNPPTLAPEDLPQQVVWESYSGRYAMIQGNMCLSCVGSPCTTCDVSWWPVTQDGLTVTATAAVKCGEMQLAMSNCGSAPSGSCTTWTGFQLNGTFEFSLTSDGLGYTAVYRAFSGGGSNPTSGGPGSGGLNGSCALEPYNGAIRAEAPWSDLLGSVRAAVAAVRLPCGA